jgi:hypothetical protein
MSPDRDLAETISKLNEFGTAFSRNAASRLQFEFDQMRKNQEAIEVEFNYKLNTVKQNESINSGLIKEHSKKIDCFKQHNQDAAENTAKCITLFEEIKKHVQEWGKWFFGILLVVSIAVIGGYMTVVNKSVSNLANQNSVMESQKETNKLIFNLIQELKEKRGKP